MQANNPNLYMEFPNGSGQSMEELFGVTEQRAGEIADKIRDIIDKQIPDWDGTENFITNIPLYIEAASAICDTPKELSFFMMKLGGFVSNQGMVYQDPEEVASKMRHFGNRSRNDVN